MKKTIYLLAVLLSACNGIQVSERLNQVDSLVVKEQFDSANVILSGLEETYMPAEEQAHYYLLRTQLGYLTNEPLPSDSLLDLAIAYYNKVENRQKLADGYYYKSYRSRINQDYPQAILYCKEAERLAKGTNDVRLQFKILESLSYLNGLCGNDQLQLHYAKKALELAQKVQNKNWMAYTYNKISFAFYNLNQNDSALAYVEKSIPCLDYVYDEDKAAFLINAGHLFKNKDTHKAKELFEKSLTYEDHPATYEHLAEISYNEGNSDEAYRLCKIALTKEGRYDKSNLIHSILSYDLERGKLDEASKYVDEVIDIKDSIIYQLRNDTIKDLQLRFDHEVAMHEADKKLISTQWLLMGLLAVLSIMAVYIVVQRKKEDTRQREHQMQLLAYTTEISQLESNRDNALSQIKELESHQEKDSQRIKKLEAEAKDAEEAIRNLNKNIKKLLDDEAPKLKRGRMLYDHIMEGGNTSRWSYKEECLFNNYYAAINYHSFCRIRKVERVSKLSSHNMFYLILKDMGKSDDEVRRILGLSLEGLRSLRNRTRPIEES